MPTPRKGKGRRATPWHQQLPTVGRASSETDFGITCRETELEMDFIFIGAIVAFFALSAGLIRFCEHLRSNGGKS